MHDFRRFARSGHRVSFCIMAQAIFWASPTLVGPPDPVPRLAVDGGLFSGGHCNKYQERAGEMKVSPDELEKYGNALGMGRPEIKDVLRRAALFPLDKERFLRLLRKQCDREGIDLSAPPPFPKPESLPTEGIHIGNSLHGEKVFDSFRLPYEALLRGHSIFTGGTGTGKTTLLACLIIPALILLGIIAIVWDVGKQYAPILSALFPPEKFITLKPNQLKMNPLIPPGKMRPEEWREIFASMWRIFDCGSGMINMLRKGLEFVYSNYSVPTLPHLRQWISNLTYKSSERAFNWRESLLDKVDSVLGVFGGGFICERGFMQNQLHRSIVFDMEGHDPLSYAFYMDLINERIRHGQEDVFSTQARIVEVVEEAHIRVSRDALVRRTTEVGERLILTHVRVMRKVGVSFIFCDQLLHLLPEVLLGNLVTWVVFRQKDARSLDRVQGILNLDDSQRQAIGLLPQRQAVVFSQAVEPVLGPFLVEIDEMKIPKVSPQGVDAKMREAIAKMHYVPAPKIESEKGERNGEGKITNTHMDVLESHANDRFISGKERCQRLGNISYEFYQRLAKDLQEMGLLREFENFGTAGKPSVTAFATEKGAEMLGKDYKDCVPPGKGGVQHRFLQNLLSKKINGVVEFMGGDVVHYNPDGSMTVFEIELGPSDDHFLKNIEVDLGIFGRVVVVSRNIQDLKILKKKAREHFGADSEILKGVDFKTIQEVLNG